MEILKFLSLVITGFFAIAGLIALISLPRLGNYYDNLEAGNLQVDSVYSAGSANYKSSYLRGVIFLPNQATPISRSKKFKLTYNETTRNYLKTRRIKAIGMQEVERNGKRQRVIKIHYLSAAPARQEQVLIPCWFSRTRGFVLLRLKEEKPSRKGPVRTRLQNAMLLLAPFLLTIIFWWVRKRRLAATMNRDTR
ncbi:MAG: hypothetical protein KTR30_02350 [Saprospiraceae bacterium]|nr:hypothetical protein [Saprospiraceae bacterium]